VRSPTVAGISGTRASLAAIGGAVDRVRSKDETLSAASPSERNAMATVTQYHVLFYGTEDGYVESRAQIALFSGSTVLGYVRFHDAGMPFPTDSKSGAQIVMHQPSAMFENVIDVLRNEKPIHFYFVSGHAFLGTAAEPIGEAE
jgi:delta-aminolevulinic acid dehydratase/porphobilinogen synthase